MNTPENNSNDPENEFDKDIVRNEENDQEKKKSAGYVGPADREDDNLDSGDTSSVASLDRSAFTRQPGRTNKPMGSGHEPGTV
jgi:hypothetical protein